MCIFSFGAPGTVVRWDGNRRTGQKGVKNAIPGPRFEMKTEDREWDRELSGLLRAFLRAGRRLLLTLVVAAFRLVRRRRAGMGTRRRRIRRRPRGRCRIGAGRRSARVGIAAELRLLILLLLLIMMRVGLLLRVGRLGLESRPWISRIHVRISLRLAVLLEGPLLAVSETVPATGIRTGSRLRSARLNHSAWGHRLALLDLARLSRRQRTPLVSAQSVLLPVKRRRWEAEACCVPRIADWRWQQEVQPSSPRVRRIPPIALEPPLQKFAPGRPEAALEEH